MTPTPTPPGGGEELPKTQRLNFYGSVPIWEYHPDGLWMDAREVRAYIASAESKHAEEESAKVTELRNTISPLMRWNSELRAQVASLESRHAEEMREAHRAGMKFGMECSITGAYVPADGGDAAFAAFLASQKEGKG